MGRNHTKTGKSPEIEWFLRGPIRYYMGLFGVFLWRMCAAAP
jgi:hypothetical protein